MKTKVIKHEDIRRVLIEYVSDSEIRRCKVIEIKEDSVLGNHYHRKTDSFFYLLRGNGTYDIWDFDNKLDGENGDFLEGECIFVPRNVVHTFKLLKGSIMLETASQPYDKEDEIQVTQ